MKSHEKELTAADDDTSCEHFVLYILYILYIQRVSKLDRKLK